MNIKASEVCKLTKNTFGKYGVYLSTFVICISLGIILGTHRPDDGGSKDL
jgi:hypothetical protein